MAQDINKLKQKLQNHIVLIRFESLKSGRIIEREYTLCEKFMTIPNILKGKLDSDKILVCDIGFNRWEDIQEDSILEWKIVG